MGQVVGKTNSFSCAGAAAGDHLDDLGDHVARAAHEDPVAHAHVLAAQLLLVVQRGAAHGDAAHEDGLQVGHRGDGAGAADLHHDLLDLRLHLFGRELEGDGPARRLRDLAQAGARIDGVDLHHQPVDLVGQGVALGEQRRVHLHHAREALHHRAPRVDRQAELLEVVELLGVRVEGLPLHHAHLVEVDGQRPRRGDLRVELAQRAGRRVARVDEGLFALPRAARSFMRLKSALLMNTSPRTSSSFGQALAPSSVEGEVLDGLQVLGDVFADGAVAAGAALDEVALLVDELDRQPVHLGLAGVGDGLEVERLLHPIVELGELGLVEDVAQGEHLLPVGDLLELLQHRAADPLGRRIGRHQIWVLGLQRQQLLHQARRRWRRTPPARRACSTAGCGGRSRCAAS